MIPNSSLRGVFCFFPYLFINYFWDRWVGGDLSVSPSARNWSYKARWSQEGEEEEIADNWEKMASSSEENLKQQLQELQKQLGKKQMFEEAVLSIKSLLVDHYSSSSPSLRKLVSNFSFPFLFSILALCIIVWFLNFLMFWKILNGLGVAIYILFDAPCDLCSFFVR